MSHTPCRRLAWANGGILAIDEGIEKGTFPKVIGIDGWTLRDRFGGKRQRPFVVGLHYPLDQNELAWARPAELAGERADEVELVDDKLLRTPPRFSFDGCHAGYRLPGSKPAQTARD